MITVSEIQSKLIEELKHSGMTQTELASKIGVAPPMISYYLHGKKMPAIDTLANLCKVLNIDANDLLCLDDNK